MTLAAFLPLVSHSIFYASECSRQVPIFFDSFGFPSIQFLITFPTRAGIPGVKGTEAMSHVCLPRGWHIPILASCRHTQNHIFVQACKTVCPSIVNKALHDTTTATHRVILSCAAGPHCLYSEEIFMQSNVYWSKRLLCFQICEPICMGSPNMSSTKHNLHPRVWVLLILLLTNYCLSTWFLHCKPSSFALLNKTSARWLSAALGVPGNRGSSVALSFPHIHRWSYQMMLFLR